MAAQAAEAQKLEVYARLEAERGAAYEERSQMVQDWETERKASKARETLQKQEADEQRETALAAVQASMEGQMEALTAEHESFRVSSTAALDEVRAPQVSTATWSRGRWRA